MSEAEKDKKNEDSEETKPNQASVLFERYMIWLVLALLIAGLWFGNIPIVVVSAFLFVISLLILIWKKQSLQGLIPSVQLSHRRIFAEDEVRITYTLSNEKWWPLVWVEWEQPAYEGFSWAGTTGEKYQLRLLWLMGYKQVTWEATGQGLRRGIYPLGDLLLRSGDAFRFSEITKREAVPADLYVYPKLLPVTVPSLSHVLQWGISGQKGGLLEDPSQISGIREYQNGDEFRKIHWQASARTGKLQTWVYKPVLPKQLFIVMDVEGFANADPDHFEKFLSTVASVGYAYHRQGVRIAHASNALDHKGNEFPYVPPVQSVTSFLDDLARMTSNFAEGAIGQELNRKENLALPVYCFCFRMEEKHFQWAKHNRKTGPSTIFYYFEESNYSRLLPGQAKPLNSLLAFAKTKGGRL